MRIKPTKIEIDKEHPFLHDLLERKESAEILTELIASIEEPFVFCIDAAWGEGKTTFLLMWKQHLENQGFSTLYYNAWENDFTDDALVSLIGELDAGVEELRLEKGPKTKAKAHLQKLKKIGAGLLKKAIPATVKIATAGVIDINEMTDEVLTNFSETFAKNQIEEYEKSKKSLKGFKLELGKFANEVSATTEPNKPLVVIIDELDRCRPTFAIEILEKAKHFFNVANIVFAVAVDKSQIGHSIRSVYGSGMDVNGYLKRFIDLEYLLPPPKKGAFAKALFNKFGLKEYFDKKTNGDQRYEYGHLLETFQGLFHVLNLSLREQEQCFSQLAIAIRTTSPNGTLFPFLLGTLLTLKIKSPQIYKDFISGKATVFTVLDEIRKLPGGTAFLDDSNYGAVLEGYFVACKSRLRDDSELLSYYQAVESNANATQKEKERAQYILKLFGSYGMRDAFGSLDYILKKIEISSQFTA
jgi:hypothetical protein